MSKSGCDYALGDMLTECGKSLPKGVQKAYLLKYDDATFAFGATGTTYNVVTAITMATGTKAVEVPDFRVEPYANTAKNSADGTYEGQFTKVFGFNFKQADILGAQDVDALTKNGSAWAVILQRDKSLGSAAFEIFGAQNPMRVTSTAADYGKTNELENTPEITMETTEGMWGVFFNCAAAGSTEAEAYAANLAAVTALLTPAEEDGGE